jgi:flagellar motility protein MotE (MotC chaperone)
MKLFFKSVVLNLSGGLLYFIITGLMLGYRDKITPNVAQHEDNESELVSKEPESNSEKEPEPSWSYFNPEVEQLVKELKEKKSKLDKEERDLSSKKLRIESEKFELQIVMKNVVQIQSDISKTLLQIKSDEQTNITRLAKTFSLMEAPAAAKVLSELGPDMAAKYLSILKPAQVAVILDSMAKVDAEGVKKVAELTNRLRLLQSNSQK